MELPFFSSPRITTVVITDKPTFAALALPFLTAFAKSNSEFLIEDVREYAHLNGLDEPAEPRWWGGIARAAQSSGLITKTGRYDLTMIGSRPQVVWRSLIREYKNNACPF